MKKLLSQEDIEKLTMTIANRKVFVIRGLQCPTCLTPFTIERKEGKFYLDTTGCICK